MVTPEPYSPSQVPSIVYQLNPEAIAALRAYLTPVASGSTIYSDDAVVISPASLSSAQITSGTPAVISPAVYAPSQMTPPISSILTSSAPISATSNNDTAGIANIDINAIAQEINSTFGIEPVQVIDAGEFKAIALPPGVDVNSLGKFAALFIDPNPADAQVGGENLTSDGHITQVTPAGSSSGFSNQSETDANTTTPAASQGIVYTWNQTLTNDLMRSMPVNGSISSQTNLTASDGVVPISADNLTSPQRQYLPDTDIDIAILDTGISFDQPDLNVYRNVTFANGTLTGEDDQGHGSHVAGIAAAKDNEVGIVGIAPGARLWAIKVCEVDGKCPILNQIKGIEYAIKHADEIDVINLSIENPNSPTLNKIIDEAVKAGITVVASAGNYGKDASQTSPANNPNVITVSAIADTDGKCGGLGPDLPPDYEGNPIKDDTFAYFSNFGPVVKIAAPGVDILSTLNGTDYGLDSGTSMAAPHVTGAAALFKAEYPDATPQEIVNMTLSSSSKPDTKCSGGPQGYFTGDVDTLNEPLLFREPPNFGTTNAGTANSLTSNNAISSTSNNSTRVSA
jgi:hypothetical protein